MSRDRNDAMLLGTWSMDGHTFRLVRTSSYQSADLVLEELHKDSLGGDRWVQRSREDSEDLDGTGAFGLRHLEAIFKTLGR